MATPAENARRITELEESNKKLVHKDVCEEKNGRVMEACGRLETATQDLTKAYQKVQARIAEEAREQADKDLAAERRSKRLMVAILMTLFAAIVGAVVNYYVFFKNGKEPPAVVRPVDEDGR